MSNASFLDRLAFSPSEAAAVLGISKPLVYDLMRSDPPLPNFTVGRRRIIPADSLREWMTERVNAERGGDFVAP